MLNTRTVADATLATVYYRFFHQPPYIMRFFLFLFLITFALTSCARHNGVDQYFFISPEVDEVFNKINAGDTLTLTVDSTFAPQPIGVALHGEPCTAAYQYEVESKSGIPLYDCDFVIHNPYAGYVNLYYTTRTSGYWIHAPAIFISDNPPADAKFTIKKMAPTGMRPDQKILVQVP